MPVAGTLHANKHLCSFQLLSSSLLSSDLVENVTVWLIL